MIQSYEPYSDALDRFVAGKIDAQYLTDVVSDRLDDGKNKQERLANFLAALEALGVSRK